MNLSQVKRFLVGAPISSQHLSEQKIPKWKALAVYSSDALSSVAYATEEILIPLAAVSVAAISYSIPIALCIVGLLVILTMSYRQTIDTYQSGGGAYIVAKENLGVHAGLVAAGALLIDYVLTVSVSSSAGVMAIISAFPALLPYRVTMAIAIIVLMTVMNLRGIRDSSTVFALPTYFFVFSFTLLLGVGLYRIATGSVATVAPMTHNLYPMVPLFIILRAFSSGCAALTGIEAISNGVPAFKEPAHINAKITMTWMTVLLMVFFFGVTALCHVFGIIPSAGETAVSLLARSIVGEGALYYCVQVSTALILILACNTAYNDFPFLAALLAKDRYLPRQLAMRGDRLVFSNSMIGLGVAAAILIYTFDGDTHLLVPLYSVGVFMSFTLSQFGMVKHHIREKEPHWQWKLFFNFIGGVTTAIVTVVVSAGKFTEGAWIVIVLLPVVILGFLKIHRHYLEVGKELSLIGVTPVPLTKLRNTVVVPISGVHRGTILAMRYATSISEDVRVCYVELNSEDTERVRCEFHKWCPGVPFVVLKSPFRSVIGTVLQYIDDVAHTMNHEMITVLIPEFVTAKWWQSILHNQTALVIRAALSFRQRKVVVSVRYHLKGRGTV